MQFETAGPAAQLERLVGQIEGQLGVFTSVEGSSSPYTVVFQDGTLTAHISLDADGGGGLQFIELTPTSGTPDEALERVEGIEGETSLLVRRDGEMVTATNREEALAVGSSFVDYVAFR